MRNYLPPGCGVVENISVARGNAILADYGRTIYPEEDLGMVLAKQVKQKCLESGEPVDIVVVPERFRPMLQQTPLTFSQPLDQKNLTQDPASSLLTQDPRQALPQIYLNSKLITYDAVENDTWTVQRDLIDSEAEDKHFVVEMDNDGEAHLRFGDGELGFLPETGTQFTATYRIGNGLSGHLGADAISYIVFRNVSFNQLKLRVHQPLPAKGGTPPETISEVKLLASRLLNNKLNNKLDNKLNNKLNNKLERAITADDYAQIVMQDFPTKVQRATAILRWIGSFYQVLVVIDPFAQEEVEHSTLLQDITAHLNLYRRIGHDVIVKQAIYVPLDVAIKVYVKSGYLRGHIKAALLDTYSNRILPGGRRGFFHPDNLTLGKGIALSQLVASAHTIPGVESVSVTKLERLFEGANGEIEAGYLSINSLEIVRLDNDPNFPENGKFSLDIRGGR